MQNLHSSSTGMALMALASLKRSSLSQSTPGSLALAAGGWQAAAWPMPTSASLTASWVISSTANAARPRPSTSFSMRSHAATISPI